MSTDDDTGPGANRLDRWLFAVRLFKSRSDASEAVGGGRVHLNGERVKPSRAVRVGDAVSFTRGAVLFECVATAIPLRRGPASQATLYYDELPASQARRDEFVARKRLVGGVTPKPDTRPDKHDRRRLRQLRGRD